MDWKLGGCVLTGFCCAVTAGFSNTGVPWDVDALFEPPQMFEATEYATNGLQAVFSATTRPGWEISKRWGLRTRPAGSAFGILPFTFRQRSQPGCQGRIEPHHRQRQMAGAVVGRNAGAG